MSLSIRETPSGLVFKIWVQPRSSKNAVVGLRGDALKIKLTAPPVEGKANKACIRFLAKCLNVPKSDIEIEAGLSSRSKQVLLALANGDPAIISEKARLKRALLELAGE